MTGQALQAVRVVRHEHGRHQVVDALGDVLGPVIVPEHTGSLSEVPTGRPSVLKRPKPIPRRRA